MDVLFLLIPLSVVLVVLVGLDFWWSVRSGQYDDLGCPAHRIFDDDDVPVSGIPGDDGPRMGVAYRMNVRKKCAVHLL